MKSHITVEEKFASRKERSSIAIKRLVCCSNTSNFCCKPNAIFYSKTNPHLAQAQTVFFYLKTLANVFKGVLFAFFQFIKICLAGL